MCLVHLYQDWNEWQAVVNLLVSRNAGGFIDRPNNYFDFGRWMISGLRLEVDDSCALLGYYAASSGNFLPTFRDNLLVQPHGTVGCPERSVRSYHYSVRSSSEESSYFRRWELRYTSICIQFAEVKRLYETV